MRLAQEDPQTRGETVRVKQRYAGQAEEPPEERGQPRSHARGSAEVRVGVSARAGGGSTRRPPPREPAPREQRRDDGPVVRDHRDGGDDGPVVRDHRDGGDDGPVVRDHRDGDDGPVVRDHRDGSDDDGPVVRDHRDGSDDDGPVVRDHRDGSDDDGPVVRDHRDDDSARTADKKPSGDEEKSTDAADKADSAKKLLVAAAVVGGVLAGTRGLRYDGWVEVDPSQPVYLRGPHGEFDWVPLADLRPEDAQWASSAFIQSHEGSVNKLGRAPIAREKWTYSVLFGPGQIPIEDEPSSLGLLGRFDIGYFPARDFGIGADFGFGWVQDGEGDTVYNSRLAVQLQSFLVNARPVHAGLFGQVGFSSHIDDGIQTDKSSALFGGGGLFQLELTTTLALTARAGITYLHGSAVGDLGLGISIY